ncbi:hypothetical protein [Vibrio neptunius]|nr:hypothetical protein [Vibrio neptunius]
MVYIDVSHLLDDIKRIRQTLEDQSPNWANIPTLKLASTLKQYAIDNSGCDAAMEVSQCSGKRSKYLKGRCHTCECTEQRSNANTQNYLQAYKPLKELNQVVELEEVLTEDTSSTLEMPQGPESPAPNSKGSGWLCAGIGAAI